MCERTSQGPHQSQVVMVILTTESPSRESRAGLDPAALRHVLEDRGRGRGRGRTSHHFPFWREAELGRLHVRDSIVNSKQRLPKKHKHPTIMPHDAGSRPRCFSLTLSSPIPGPQISRPSRRQRCCRFLTPPGDLLLPPDGGPQAANRERERCLRWLRPTPSIARVYPNRTTRSFTTHPSPMRFLLFCIVVYEIGRGKTGRLLAVSSSTRSSPMASQRLDTGLLKMFGYVFSLVSVFLILAKTTSLSLSARCCHCC